MNVPTAEEWAMFVALPFPASLYKHTCKVGGFTVMGRQSFYPKWVDHKHYGATAGDAIRKASAEAERQITLGPEPPTGCRGRS